MQVFGNLDVDNSFKEFWCKQKARNGIVHRKEELQLRIKVVFFFFLVVAVFQIGEIITLSVSRQGGSGREEKTEYTGEKE